MSVEGTIMQLPRQIIEPQCDISCPSKESQILGKTKKSAYLVETPTKRGRFHLSNGN